MKKKKAVVIDEWQDDYVKKCVEEHGDISYSEAIRVMISISAITACNGLYGNKSPTKDVPEWFVKNSLDSVKHKLDYEKLHKFLAEVHFQGRTAWEHRKQKEGL